MEDRYIALFRLVDLTKDFYFSYTYDLTRTVQQHMTCLPRSGSECFATHLASVSCCISLCVWGCAVCSANGASTVPETDVCVEQCVVGRDEAAGVQLLDTSGCARVL